MEIRKREGDFAGGRGTGAGGFSVIKTIQGNLIQFAQNGGFDLIVHGSNCFCTMGAGIAQGIKAALQSLRHSVESASISPATL